MIRIGKKFWKIPLVLLLMLFMAFVCTRDASVPSVKEKPKLTYYYFTPCEACNEFARFTQYLAQTMKATDVLSRFQIIGINGFKDDDKSFSKMCDTIGISAEQRKEPMLVCGRQWLAHDLDKPETVKAFIEKCLSGNTAVSTDRSVSNGREAQKKLDLSAYPELQNLSPDDSVLLLFTVSSCTKCDAVLTYLHRLPNRIDVSINNRKISSAVKIIELPLTQSENTDLVYSLFNRFDVPAKQRKVPVLFFSGGYLSGQDAIEQGLPEILDKGKALNFSINALKVETASLSWYDLTAVLAAGLIGGINPCSVSMLFFLMSLLFVRRANVLKLGMLFITARMAAYFLIGTVLSSLLAFIGTTLFTRITFIVNIVLILLLFFLSAASLYDFFAAKKEKYGNMKLQLPRKLRRMNHSLIEKAVGTNRNGLLCGTVFALGLFLSLGEFLCTGQVYLATIVYLLKKAERFTPVLYLSLGAYVAAMSVPAIILTLLIYKGRQIVFLSEAIRKRMPAIKLTNCIFFLLIMVFLIDKLF